MVANAAEDLSITIPHQFTPRTYQDPFFVAMNTGLRRACLVWHRRAGKDKVAFNYLIEQMFKRVGVYYYLFPTYAQGKKVLWKGIDADGFKVLNHFPKELIVSTNESDLSVELVNGSYFQIVGTDNYDAIMGTNPVGCVFSEYALQDPRAWAFIRPILRENGGWAVFDFTPRGKNHGYDLYRMAKDNPDWYCSLLTVDDTLRPNGKPVISPADIQAERLEGMEEELVQQEYFCSFDMGVQGAYFFTQMAKAEAEGRICSVPYDEAIPVSTYWDLGMDDSMTIWFMQRVGKEIRLIDYSEETGKGFPEHKKILDKRGYVYDHHFMPHDVNVRELGTGVSRQAAAETLGIKPITRVPRIKRKDESIAAARSFLSKCWFDDKKCRDGIDALKNYTKVYDEKNHVFRPTPLHNWASHGADAFQTLAVGFEEAVEAMKGTGRSYHGDSGWMGN